MLDLWLLGESLSARCRPSVSRVRTSGRWLVLPLTGVPKRGAEQWPLPNSL